MHMSNSYSVPTNFRLELLEPSAGEVLIFRERRMGGECGEEKITRLKPSETRKKRQS